MPPSNFFHPRQPLPCRTGLARVIATPWPLALWACVLALCLPLRSALAQQPAAATASAQRWTGMSHTVFTHHTQSGLSSALCIVQDRQGFVWLGTQSGLVRWDGNRYVKYTADATRSDAIPDSYIMSLHIDRRGQLWAGMSAGGLARYNPARNNFVRYGASPGGLRDARVTALADDGADGLWIGTGKGLDHINAEGAITGRATPWNTTLPAGGIDALLYDRQGTLWIGTRRGLFKLPATSGARLQAVALGASASKNKPVDDDAPAVHALYQDSSGRIWVGTRTRGAFSLDADASSASAVRESGVNEGGNGSATLHTERVSTIVEAVPGEIWLGTSSGDGGIVVVDTRRGATHRIRHQSDTPDSLADNSIMALFRDQSGIIHVGHMSGMSQHDPLPRAITTIRHLDTPSHGAGPSASTSRLSVPSMMETPDGRLWLGMVNGGINIVDPYLGLRRQLLAGTDLPRTQVLAMASGPDGAVYIGTGQGLYRADRDGRRVRRLAVPQRRDDDEVWALAVVDNTLWLGGLDGVRQLGFKSAGGSDAFTLLRHESSSLGDPRVTALLVQGPDLWVGTRTGLARLAPDTVELIPTDLAAPDRLPPGYVSSLMTDQQGRLWLSNFGTGIVILQATGADGRRRFQRLGIVQGLPDNSANMLLQDRQGMIWASTDAGLARIDPQTLAIRAIGPGEGVHVPTYWTNSGVFTRAGELIFGGLSGLTVLHPQPLSTWRYVPPVVVTRILLNDQQIPSALYNPSHTGATGTGKASRAVAPVTILPEGRERGFSLEFAALDYSAPERNRYSYRLQGFDPTWVETDANARRASYNNLPPGDYVLQLRGSNRNGDWAPVLAVPVRVLPAWHQRPLARLLMVALGLLAAAGLMQLRTRYLRRRQRELEAVVEARTAELRATQAQLETLAYGDPLTGLANRRLFNDELRQLVAQAERGAATFTLLLIDLDHFKQINDTLGHDAGDALLAAVAGRLRAALREADRPFRLGGDEFAVLLSHSHDTAVPAQDALAVLCERILDSLAQPLPHGSSVIQVSASIGAAVCRHGDDHEQLYKQADLALYQAKGAGRNTWRLASVSAR
ncbi:MAG: diguanylate cyclase [Duganella sp.]